MAAEKTADSQIYQLKVTLAQSKPPIWRRIQIGGSATLGELHTVIQRAMGWYDCHLHQFVVDDRIYGIPDLDWDMGTIDEDLVKIEDVVGQGNDRFDYEYDFGDSWIHRIVVEKVLAAEKGVRYPVCITGRRACPPEDVGGIWGYGDFLEIIGDPSHPEHGEWMQWVGGSFDAEEIDLDSINRQL